MRRVTKHYPSRVPQSCSTELKPKKVYTGNKIVGIALLHKQAYTPVYQDEDPADISKMRRG